MRRVVSLLAAMAIVAGCLSSATSAPSGQASAAPGAWTQSDIFKGFDPMSIDLTGYTPGPNGEHSTNAADVPDPTPDCVAKIKRENLKLAFLNGLSGNTWMAAIEKGVRETAATYGISVPLTAATDFDPAKEASAVETVMAGKPDILVAIPADPVASKASFQPALDAGTTIVFYDNPVTGWSAGNQYVTISTGDHYRMGKDAADLLAQALGGKGNYGFIQLDVAFYNSNNREKGFLAEMAQKYPNMHNVAWAGFTDASTVGASADAMLTQHPDLDGIYISYSGGAVHLRRVLRLVADEPHAFACRLPVVVLLEAVRPYVPEEDVDVHLRVYLFELQGVLYRLAAAQPAAIVPLLVPAAHALDHNEALGPGDLLVACGDLLLKLEVGHDPLVLPVKVLGWRLDLRAYRR